MGGKAMRWMQHAVIAALVAVLVTGCGTIINLATGDPDVPFGGVQKDLTLLEKPGTGYTGTMNGNNAGAVIMLGFMAADLCLSFIADTLTLPIAVWMRQNPPSSEDSAHATGKSDTVENSTSSRIAGVSLGKPHTLGQVDAEGQRAKSERKEIEQSAYGPKPIAMLVELDEQWSNLRLPYSASVPVLPSASLAWSPAMQLQSPCFRALNQVNDSVASTTSPDDSILGRKCVHLDWSPAIVP